MKKLGTVKPLTDQMDFLESYMSHKTLPSPQEEKGQDTSSEWNLAVASRMPAKRLRAVCSRY